MRSTSAAQTAAILSQFRDVSTSVSIGGSTTTWPVTQYSTDAQMTDTPAQISQLGGVAARTVTFKIDHTYAKAISPYQPSLAPAALPLPIGTSVVVSISFWPGIARTGTPTYTANLFTGYITSIPTIDGVSDISVTAQDPSYNLGSLVSLPGAGITSNAAVDLTTDLYYSSLAVIDMCLRGCGQYLAAPPVLTGAARAAFTMLSIPNCGGMIPDVGSVITQYVNGATIFGLTNSGVRRTAGKFTPDVIGCYQSQFRMPKNLANVTDFKEWRLDTWVKFSLPMGTTGVTVVRGGQGAGIGGGASPGVQMFQTGEVDISFGNIGGGGVVSWGTPASGSLADGNWHHVNATVGRIGNSCTAAIAIDGVNQTLTGANPQTIAGVSWIDDVGSGDTLVIGAPATAGDGVVFVEDLEIIYVPTGATYTDPANRNGQTGTITSAITATPARLQAIAPQTGLNAWQTIQAVAAAEGALCWFDEDGKFVFEPRTTWLARRTAASARTFDASMFGNISMGVSRDGLRKTVSANYSAVTAIASTAAVPAYTADTVLTFASGTTTQQIATTSPFISPATPAVGASNVVGNSWYYPVAASRVGDPAANLLVGVTISIVPTATGFTLTVNNPYGGTIALWNPTAGTIPQGPALVIHGTRIVTGDPILVSYTGNTSAKDDLLLPDNPWRQDLGTTKTLVYVTAMDCYNIIPVIQNIDVPGDPRVQLGDLVTLQDGRVNSLIQTPGGIQCVLVDIAHKVSPNADYRMTLGVQPAGPPTGWLAGVPGRSEAGTTTYASIP